LTPVPWTAVVVTEAAPTVPVVGQRRVPVAPVVPVMPVMPTVGQRRVPVAPVVSRRGLVSRFGVRGRVRSDCAALVPSGRVRVWRVRPGDTLGLVSGCVRVPVAVLADRNRLVDPDLILVGQPLVIPARTS
jgi:hypothetical protein